MTLPTPRGFARAICVLSSLALLSTAPAPAQDCWIPDRFEPNDAVPTFITPGLHSELRLHAEGAAFEYGADTTLEDVDRFRLSVPAHRQLVFELRIGPTGPAAVSHPPRVLAIVTPAGAEDGGHGIIWDASNADVPLIFWNAEPLAQDVDLVLEPFWSGGVVGFGGLGCIDYELDITVTRRPCDVLQDDALEGPEDCQTGTVLQPGMHQDLIAFNDLRAAGPDADFYRVLGVEPGNGFRLYSEQAGDVSLEFFELPSCVQLHQDDWYPIVQNTGAVPRDYAIKVTSLEASGYSRYDLRLEYSPCASTPLDSLEPNDACGPFTLLTPGTHTDLSIGPGDTDGFEVMVPAGYRLAAQVAPHADGAPLRVSGGAPGACVPLSTTPSYNWFSQETSTVPHHIAVFADAGYCGEYDLLIYVDAPHNSDALLALDEPNDDCASATQIDMELDDQGVPESTNLTRMVHQGDVDYFRLSVPPGKTYGVQLYRGFGPYAIDTPAFELLAYEGGACTGNPKRGALGDAPWNDSGIAGLLEVNEIGLVLPNRGAHPLEYTLSVEAFDMAVDRWQYLISIDPESANRLPTASDGPSLDCHTAVPLCEAQLLKGLFGAGRPLLTSLSLEPGETVTASTWINELLILGSKVALRIHDGVADCSVDGALLGEVVVDPILVPSNSPHAVRVSYTNHGIDSRRVIVELVAGDECANFVSGVELRVDRGEQTHFEVYCSSVSAPYSQVPCPCGNEAHTGQHLLGCRNSSGVGARLWVAGSNLPAADDLSVHVEGLPADAPGVLLHSGVAYYNPRSFHDGLLCITAHSQPIRSFTAGADGTWSCPESLQALLAADGHQPPAISTTQVWYRDADGPCASGANTTNALRIRWDWSGPIDI